MPSALDPWRDAAHRLPLGRNEKLFLGIAAGAPFEDETGCSAIRMMRRPGPIATSAPSAGPSSNYFLGATSADRVTQEGAAAAFTAAIDELTALTGSAVRPMLHPIAASDWTRIRALGRWGQLRAARCAAQRQLLALPFEDRIFFVGEATSTTDFSTAHGAFASGVRAPPMRRCLFFKAASHSAACGRNQRRLPRGGPDLTWRARISTLTIR